MCPDDWAENEPNNEIGNQYCTGYCLENRKYYDVQCNSLEYGVCEISGLQTFQLRGSCLDSGLDSFYVLKGSRVL